MVTGRLRRLIELLPVSEVVADVGTDHGYLLVEALRSGKARFGIGTDRRPGPLDSARSLIVRTGYAGQTQLRLGFGLLPLQPAEATTIVVAGMGGYTVREVLESSRSVSAKARFLLLQPNGGVIHLRTWLLTHGFYLCLEDLVDEGGHLYLIIGVAPDAASARDYVRSRTIHRPDVEVSAVVAPVSGCRELEQRARESLDWLGLNAIADSFWLELGPLLLAERHPLLGVSLERESARLDRIIRDAAHETNERRSNRAQAALRRRQQVEKVRAWLSASTK